MLQTTHTHTHLLYSFTIMSFQTRSKRVARKSMFDPFIYPLMWGLQAVTVPYHPLQMFVWLMSASYSSGAILLCECRLPICETSCAVRLRLRSTLSCLADRLAGESLYSISGSTPLSVRTWRENIIDCYKDRALFSHVLSLFLSLLLMAG